MKIAFVTQHWDEVVPPVEGGSIPILTYQIARRLTRCSEVVIYAKRGRSQQKVQCDDEGIHYRRMSVTAENWLLKPFKLLDRLPGFCNPKRPLFASSLYYLGYALQVAHDLRKQQPDIVHIHNFSQFVPIIRAFNPEAKIALHMHCEWLTQLDPAMIERRLRQADLVIGCSEYITKKVLRCFPQFASRCQTVFNGVDVNQFVSENGHSVSKENDVKRLLFVGRISPEKGVHILLDAFQKVVEHYPQVQLDIIGPGGNVPFEFIVLVSDDEKVSDLASFYGRILRRGDYFSYLQSRLPSNLASHVNFVGPVPNSHVIDYYRKADVLINPSFSEAFGMSLVEAMACQVPIVATRVGGMTEVIEQSQAGLLTEPGDATALAQAILRLLIDDNLRKRMGVAGRKEAVTRYSWDQVAKKLLGLYENTCYGNE
jgi:glycosyltransferase involved in cell wall biosynthesis